MAARPRLLVIAGASGLPPGALERVEGLVEPTVVTDRAGIERHLPGAELVLLWEFKSQELRELWHLADSLRWVQVAAAGVDAVMFPALQQSDVIVTNARGVFDVPMAEFALACMLFFAKKLDRALDQQRRHEFRHFFSDMLAGRTLVIVGLGSIGRTLAVRARALGMRVVGVRRGGQPDASADAVYPTERLREALAEGDFVVIFTPRTPQTLGMFGRAELAAVKSGAVVVNLGRGGVVDEAALLEALQAGRFKAADDVFSQEPLPPDNPLWDAHNLLFTPHVGGDDEQANERILDAWADNVRRYLNGEPLQNLVDKQQGY